MFNQTGQTKVEHHSRSCLALAQLMAIQQHRTLCENFQSKVLEHLGCGGGGGRKLSSRVHTSTCIFHEAAERERPPRAQEPLPTCPKTLSSGVPNGLHGTRNGTPKPHINRPLVTPAKFDHLWAFLTPTPP